MPNLPSALHLQRGLNHHPQYAADVRVCRGVPVVSPRRRKEFWSCGVWSGCSGDLDVLKVCLSWRELGLDASRGPLKTCVPKCRCRGKQAKMNMLVDTAAERDRCQLKLQSCKCLCEEIYIAAILFGIFSDYFCKHKKNKSENCLHLLSLA